MAHEADEDELRENRFSYLLQPIRDLASNWDIDIAAELEEYLDELEHITFSIEGCGPALNFAEAALLIQGTTCVFSKKVEHLHNLVYQALDTIINKKQKERLMARKGEKGQRAAEADLDDAETFFDLEATIDQADDIDLQEEEEPVLKEMVRPPPALLALEDGNNGEGDGDAGSYRLAQCTVHASGALLLEGKDGAEYDQQLRSRHRPPTRRHGAAAVAAAGGGGDGAAWVATGGGAAEEAGAAAAGGEAGADEDMWGGGAGEYDDGGYDDYDGEGAIDLDDGLILPVAAAVDGAQEAGSVIPDWVAAAGAEAGAADGAAGADGAPAPEQQQQQQQQQLPQQLGDGQQVPPSAAKERRTARQRGRAGERPAAAAAAYYDPWEPLDPADPGTLPVRPLQVRRPKKSGCKLSGAAMAFLPPLDPTSSQGPAGTGTNTSSSSSSHAATAKALVGGLFHKELSYVVEQLLALRATADAQARRQQRQQQKQRVGGGVLAPQGQPALDWADAAAAEQQEQQLLLEDQQEAEQEMPAADWDDGGGDDGWDGPGLEQLEDAAAAGGGGRAGWGGGWGADLAASAVGAAADPASLSYEELCRAHIEALIAAAAAQQVQSELQVRVSSWRQRIDPILRQEEDRSAFDIHQYGAALLTRLSNLSLGTDHHQQQQDKRRQKQQQVVEVEGVGAAFGQVVAAQDSFEVCRSFAAMLQLINNRNINLMAAQDPEQPFQLQLLSTDMLHETMGDHLAVAPEAAAAAAAGSGGGGGKKGGGRKGTKAQQQQQQQQQPLQDISGEENVLLLGKEVAEVPVKQAAKRAKTARGRAAA